MKKLVLIVTAFLGISTGSAFAACTGPAVMHDFPGTSFNMSLATNTGDGNCVSNNAITTWGGVQLGAASAYGTSPGAVNVMGVNAFVTNFPSSQAVTGTFWQATQPVSGTFWQTTQPVTVASLPLPSGAATSANQSTEITSLGTIATNSGTQATAANQTTGNTALGTLHTDLTTLNTTAGSPLAAQTGAIWIGNVDPHTAANWGIGATTAAPPANGVYGAGLASSSEPTAATTGNLTGGFFDLAGKQVTSPYANRENQLRCAITLTASTSATTCTGMGAQGASVKIYITDLTCTRNDAGTTASTLTLNDGATTIVDLPNNGGGGGYSHTFNTPLQVAANTAFTVQSGTSLTSVHCSAAGFKGY